MAIARNQSADAQLLYDRRSVTYDDSWHVRFARHLVEMASPKSGQNVLDLACGTGLATIPVAEMVGPSATVIGVDISSGMLAQAQKKVENRPHLQHVAFYQHSITELDTLEAVKQHKAAFDLITCASALVLLPKPEEAVKQWVEYLKPGGKLITDVTHIQSQLAGITYERVGRRLGVAIPHHRINFQKPEDLQAVMENAGLRNIEILPVAQLTIEGTDDLEDYLAAGAKLRVEKEYAVGDSHYVFESTVDRIAWGNLGKTETRDQARNIFKEEWAQLVEADGKVRELDCVYVGIGTKP